MSSQGLAAAAEGLNQGFDQGLQAMRQRALLGMQQQQLALQQQQARAGLAEKGIASVDESGNINPVPGFDRTGNGYFSAVRDNAMAANQIPLAADQAKSFGLPEGTTSINKNLIPLVTEGMKNPNIFGSSPGGDQPQGLSALLPSQMGNGPTVIGSTSGLGSLANIQQSSPKGWLDPPVALNKILTGKQDEIPPDQLASITRSEKGREYIKMGLEAQNQNSNRDLRKEQQSFIQNEKQKSDDLQRTAKKDDLAPIEAALNRLDQIQQISTAAGKLDPSALSNAKAKGMSALASITGNMITPSSEDQNRVNFLNQLRAFNNAGNVEAERAMFGTSRIAAPIYNRLTNSSFPTEGDTAEQMKAKNMAIAEIYKDTALAQLNAVKNKTPIGTEDMRQRIMDKYNAAIAASGGADNSIFSPSLPQTKRAGVGSGTANDPYVGNPSTHQPQAGMPSPEEARAELARRKAARGGK